MARDLHFQSRMADRGKCIESFAVRMTVSTAIPLAFWGVRAPAGTIATTMASVTANSGSGTRLCRADFEKLYWGHKSHAKDQPRR